MNSLDGITEILTITLMIVVTLVARINEGYDPISTGV